MGIQFKKYKLFLLKFRYCENAKKFEKISHLVLKLLSNVKTKWEVFSNIYGLLRMSELTTNKSKANEKIV